MREKEWVSPELTEGSRLQPFAGGPTHGSQIVVESPPSSVEMVECCGTLKPVNVRCRECGEIEW